MMNAKHTKKPKTWALLAGCCLILSSLTGWSQPPGSDNFEMYDPMNPDGSRYFDLSNRAQRPRQEEQEVRVLVKKGKKIYCAWSNQLLHNDVTFEEITPEEASKYYDDGTHNDEIPFDGLPSSVIINKSDHLSPYAIAIKERMEELRDKVLTLETSEDFKIAMWKQLDKWDPMRFYSGLYVTSLDPKSDLPRYVDKMTDQTDAIQIFEEDAILPFQGLDYYPDKEYPSWENRLWSKVDPKDKAVRKEMGLDRKRQQQQNQEMYPGMPGGGPMPGMGI